MILFAICKQPVKCFTKRRPKGRRFFMQSYALLNGSNSTTNVEPFPFSGRFSARMVP